MTLNGRNAPLLEIEKSCRKLRRPPEKNWLKIDTNCQRKMYRWMILVSRNIRYIRDIREGFFGEGRQTTVGCRTAQFSTFVTRYMYKNYRHDIQAIMQYIQPFDGFSVVPNARPWTNPNSYFALNFCYPVCVNSFNVLLTNSVDVCVERSPRDYPRLHCALIAPDCTQWHGVLPTIRSSNTCANSHSYLYAFCLPYKCHSVGGE